MGGVRRWIAASLVIIAACCTASVTARASEPCGQVVSYFMYPYQGSALKQHEWRMYDPSRGGDALFLANAGGFDELRWDPNFSTAWYRSGLTLYSVDWKRGARPKPICTLPEIERLVDWWFNPDSASWQCGSAVMFDTSAARLHFACELWQSSRDFKRWRCILSDTLECESGECDEWSWTEGEWARHAPSVTVRDLDAPSWPATWAARALPFDSVTVTTRDAGSGGADGWYYVGTSHASRRGIAFRMRHASEPEASEPYYFVDLDRKTRRRMETLRPDDAWSSSLMAERCGLLLLPGPTGNPLIVNPSSGRVVFSRAWNAKRAVWVTRPRW